MLAATRTQVNPTARAIIKESIELTTEAQPLIPQAHGTESGDSVANILIPEGKGTPIRKLSGDKVPRAINSLRSRD